MEKYDSSWDQGNEALWDKKYEEWKKREWLDWLEENLSLPFEVKRMEDMDSNPFTEKTDNPFAVGETFKVIDLDDEDEMRGIIVRVSKGRNRGFVLLADVEVASKADENFWPVREYVVWFANQ